MFLYCTIKVSCYLPLFSWKEGVRVMTPVHGYRGSEKQGCKYPQRRFFINQPEKLLLGWNTFLQEFCRGYWNQSTLEPVFSWNTFPLRGSVEVIETWLLTPFWEIIPIIPPIWLGHLYSIRWSCKLDWHIWKFGAQALGVQITWCPNNLVPNWLGVPEYRSTGVPVYRCTGVQLTRSTCVYTCVSYLCIIPVYHTCVSKQLDVLLSYLCIYLCIILVYHTCVYTCVSKPL